MRPRILDQLSDRVRGQKSNLILIGSLVLITVAAWAIYTLQTARSPSRIELKKKLNSLGDMTVIVGSAESRFSQSPEFTAFKEEPVVSTETVRTDGSGRVEFYLEGGGVLELNESSRALFELRAKTIQIKVLEGNIEIKKLGEPGSYEISREDSAPAVVTAEKFGQTLVVPTKVTAAADSDNDSLRAAQGEAVPETDLQTLSQDEILRALQAQNVLFRRCYVNLMQNSKNQNQKVDVLVSFFIQSNGKLTDARIWHSSVEDQIFLKCVSEVFERTRFRNFQGDAVRVDEFPLSFQ